MIVDMWLELLFLILLWGAHPVVGSLRGPSRIGTIDNDNLKVKVPRVAFIGQDVELECTFPWMDPNSLYSIKWWRDNDQFYQYIPKTKGPKMNFFKVNGIRVVMDKSTEFKVSLRNLTLNSSGAFTCEVMADGNFETLRKSANMTVIDPPDRDEHGNYGPVIEVNGWNGVGPLEVRDGQRVVPICHARDANPPVVLKWHYNGTEVPREYVMPQTSRMVGLNSYTYSLRLDLTANQLWDEQGRMMLQCTADIPGLFHESAMLELHNPSLRRARLTGRFSSGISASPSTPLMIAAVLISLMVLRGADVSVWL